MTTIITSYRLRAPQPVAEIVEQVITTIDGDTQTEVATHLATFYDNGAAAAAYVATLDTTTVET